MTNNLLGNIGIIMINPHITGWKDQSSETIHPSIGSNFCKLIRLTGKPQYLCSTTRQFLSRCESAAIRSMALGRVVLYLFFVWWFKVVPSGVFWEMLSRTIDNSSCERTRSPWSKARHRYGNTIGPLEPIAIQLSLSTRVYAISSGS